MGGKYLDEIIKPSDDDDDDSNDKDVKIQIENVGEVNLSTLINRILTKYPDSNKNRKK